MQRELSVALGMGPDSHALMAAAAHSPGLGGRVMELLVSQHSAWELLQGGGFTPSRGGCEGILGALRGTASGSKTQRVPLAA